MPQRSGHVLRIVCTRVDGLTLIYVCELARATRGGIRSQDHRDLCWPRSSSPPAPRPRPATSTPPPRTGSRRETHDISSN